MARHKGSTCYGACEVKPWTLFSSQGPLKGFPLEGFGPIADMDWAEMKWHKRWAAFGLSAVDVKVKLTVRTQKEGSWVIHLCIAVLCFSFSKVRLWLTPNNECAIKFPAGSGSRRLVFTAITSEAPQACNLSDCRHLQECWWACYCRKFEIVELGINLKLQPYFCSQLLTLPFSKWLLPTKHPQGEQ